MLMHPPGLLRLKVMAVRVLAVQVAILGSELTILELFVAELFYTSYKPPPYRRKAHQKSLTNSDKLLAYRRRNRVS